jgi:hypothetical protein
MKARSKSLGFKRSLVASLGDRSAAGGATKPAVFGLTLVAVTTLGLASLQSGRRVDNQAAPQAGRPLVAILDQGQPLMPASGEQTTLADAAATAGFPLYRPAGAGPPSEVWIAEVDQGRYEVALRFDTDLVALLGVWPEGKDPVASLESMTSDSGAGYTTTIDGNPARVRPYDPSKGEEPVNVVTMVVGGVEVILYGKADVDQLIGLASDLRS